MSASPSAFSLVQTVLLAVLIGIAHFLSRGGTSGRVGGTS